jgi:hypothetical protein
MEGRNRTGISWLHAFLIETSPQSSHDKANADGLHIPTQPGLGLEDTMKDRPFSQ